MIYIDSNFWIYWLDQRLPEHPYVERTMRGALGEGVVMSRVTLLEVAHYLRALPERQFLRQMDAMRGLTNLSLLDLDQEISDMALEMLPELSAKGLGGRDCIILATMKAAGIERIATHDHAFESVKGITVIDGIPRRRGKPHP